MTPRKKPAPPAALYPGLVGGIGELLETVRRASARSVNALMTATYWEIGRRIVEFEQGGAKRAGYGEELLKRLAGDLTARFGRGFSAPNLNKFKQLYLAYPPARILSTVSIKSAASPVLGLLNTPPGRKNLSTLSMELPAAIEIASMVSNESNPTQTQKAPAPISQTVSGKSLVTPIALADLARAFPLPWSHYVLLIGRSRSPEAFAFYHAEALRGGWSVRQLDRQMASLFYERVALSKDKAAVLRKGARPQPADVVSVDEEVRHPLVLEFLGLRDEYSETNLEDALVRHLESFLLELGNDFAFVGRQRRLRIDDEWYRVDLLFFHRRLRCLVIFDLKLGRFTHADAGQMNLYLNYAREHWVQSGENPPVGIILCSGQGEALVRYATAALPNKLLVREYLLALPDEKTLAAELQKTRAQLESRRPARGSTR